MIFRETFTPELDTAQQGIESTKKDTEQQELNANKQEKENGLASLVTNVSLARGKVKERFESENTPEYKEFVKQRENKVWEFAEQLISSTSLSHDDLLSLLEVTHVTIPDSISDLKSDAGQEFLIKNKDNLVDSLVMLLDAGTNEEDGMVEMALNSVVLMTLTSGVFTKIQDYKENFYDNAKAAYDKDYTLSEWKKWFGIENKFEESKDQSSYIKTYNTNRDAEQKEREKLKDMPIIPFDKVRSTWIAYSKSWCTLCSQTARLDIQKQTWLHIQDWNAVDAMQKVPQPPSAYVWSMYTNSYKGFRKTWKDLWTFNFNKKEWSDQVTELSNNLWDGESVNVADVYMEGLWVNWKMYGHRCSAHKVKELDGSYERYIIDPYRKKKDWSRMWNWLVPMEEYLANRSQKVRRMNFYKTTKQIDKAA